MINPEETNAGAFVVGTGGDDRCSSRGHEAGWTRLADSAGEADRPVFWRSDAAHDPEWDAFLLSTPLGQFQQAAGWARVKALDGWRATRFIATTGGEPVAGCQVLWKAKSGFRFGYASKGPVIIPGASSDADLGIQLLQRATRVLRLSAIIAQPPDFDSDLEPAMTRDGFLPNRLQSVFSATVLVDLDRPFEQVEAEFAHIVERDVRRARKQNVQTRFGGSADAGVFFRLMKDTCARQHVSANPSRAENIAAILREFTPHTSRVNDPTACCLIGERSGQPIAGLLLIRFGDRLSMWKKGTAGDAGADQPNRFLDWTAMKWAHEIGCRTYDLVGISHIVAERLLAGMSLTEAAAHTSDYYKLLFGGKPRLLPGSCIWSPTRSGRVLVRVLQLFR